MFRRNFVRASGTVATVGVTTLAGCGDDGGDDQEPTQDTPTEPDGGTPTEGDEGTPSEGQTGTEDGTQTGGGDGGGQNTIAMEAEGEEYYFDPIGLHVESGTAVTFTIESGSHSSTAYQEGNGPAEETRIPEGAEAWDSGTLSEAGETFEHTFETAGTYDYFCAPHKSFGMVGRIVVDEPGGPAEGSMPPDGEVPDSGTIVDRGAVPHDEFEG